MSDPKPYTVEEVMGEPVDDVWGRGDTRAVVQRERVLATVEALERAERERDASRNALAEHREDADRCIAAETKRRVEAERERDEETRKRYAAESAHDLMAREKERAEHAHNALLLTVAPLKAALRELLDMAQGLGVSFLDDDEEMAAEAVLHRAREALGEVE